MRLEDQVCSLESAKRLKELGVKQESLYWWNWNTEPATLWFEDRLNEREEWSLLGWARGRTCSAFTVAELGEMLQIDIKTKKRKEWEVYTDYSYVGKGKTEADARAKMLIYLLENKLISPL